MADSREGDCDSSDESSHTIQDSTSEYSTETDEEDLTEATTSSGGRKRSKTCRGKGDCEDHAAAKKKKKSNRTGQKRDRGSCLLDFFFR